MPASHDGQEPGAIETMRGSPETVRKVGLWMLIAWLVFAIFEIQPWRLSVNRTDSEPPGLYLIHRLAPDTVLADGDLVAFSYLSPFPFPPYSTWDRTTLLKRIAAGPGDVLTTSGRCQYANGAPLGCALEETPTTKVSIPHFAHFDGTPVPEGDYYLQGDGNPASYDSRYFGLVPRTRMLGTARPLWIW